MTTKPKASKYRIRRPAPTSAAQPAPEQDAAGPSNRVQRPAEVSAAANATPPMNANVDSAATVKAETDIDSIRQEGLTGRQLRMARRVAQKHGLAVTSDFDAVKQLRQRGIDPFQRANVLELVTPNDAQTNDAATAMQGGGAGQPPNGNAAQIPAPREGGVQLPQTIVKKQSLPSTDLAVDDPAERRASEIRKIQKDMARRRRKKMYAMIARLGVFVFLPTLIMGWYFAVIATPMYTTKSEFIIQKAEATGSSGFGGLFQGTGLAAQSDSVTAQAFIVSRPAMVRLIEEEGFKEHFQNPDIDAIQRLAPDASNEDAFGLYQDLVQVGYDPSEGILKMEVTAADPDTSQRFSEALISYAEQEIDQASQRMRQDQMKDSITIYEQAEQSRQDALNALQLAQTEVEVVDPTGAIASLQQRISALELELDQKQIELSSIQAASSPNQARVNGVTAEINRLNQQIAVLRGQVSGLASTVARLREAEENYAFSIERVTAAQAAMDQARIEANRQVRFLSVAVAPIAPDDPTYPRVFEGTLLSFLVFSGIYLMFSLTASILREQVSS